MLYGIYRGLTSCAAPVLDRLLQKRMAAGKEEAARVGERRGHATLSRPPGKVMWLHGASVGEALSVLPLLDELHHRLPEWHFLMTTGTVTSARLLAARLPSGVMHQFVPWDQPSWVARFFDHWRPDAILWLESELWPNILHEVKKRDVPAALLNARMRPKTFARWRLLPGFAARLLDTFQVVLVGARGYLPYFTALGGRDVRYVGNLKFAAKPVPVDGDKLAALRESIADRPCLGIMQTHAGEELLAAETARALRQTQPGLLTIIALRKPARGREVAAMLGAKGHKVALRSQDEPIAADTELYIADTIGEMGLWYSLCPIAVIGGSFIYFGGQNPLEAAHFGCAILYGPSMFNFPELCAVLEERDAALPLAGPEALLPALRDLLAHPDRLARLQDSARAVAGAGSEVVAAYADILIARLVAADARA